MLFITAAGLLWETSTASCNENMSNAMVCGGDRDLLSSDNLIKSFQVTSEYIQCLDQLPQLIAFVRNYLQSQLIDAANHLHCVGFYCFN